MAEIRPREQSEKTESYRENVWNVTEKKEYALYILYSTL